MRGRARRRGLRLRPPLGHHLKTAESVQLEHLSRERLIMLTVEDIETATARLLGALDSPARGVPHPVGGREMRSLVATGAGIAILHDLIYRPWSIEGDRIEWRDVSGTLPVEGASCGGAACCPKRTTHDFISIAKSQRVTHKPVIPESRYRASAKTICADAALGAS